MFLINWEPKVTATVLSNKWLTNEALHFTATLSCPCCGHENAVQSSGHLVHSQTSIAQNIAWKVGDLEKRRDCEKCGTTSSMPAPDKARLLQEATETVTDEWVTQEENKLKDALKAA
jgi:transcription elongation factor Elf1